MIQSFNISLFFSTHFFLFAALLQCIRSSTLDCYSFIPFPIPTYYSKIFVVAVVFVVIVVVVFKIYVSYKQTIQKRQWRRIVFSHFVCLLAFTSHFSSVVILIYAASLFCSPSLHMNLVQFFALNKSQKWNGILIWY